jgi:nucleoid DNA-binding protein
MGMTHSQFLAAYKDNLEELGFEGLTKADIKVMTDAFGDTLLGGLKSQVRAKVVKPVVVIKGVGRFTLATKPARPARMGRNPATGEAIKIAAKRASKVLKAAPDKGTADALNVAKRS